MLVKDIGTRVRDLVGDSDQIQFNNDTLINWINDGIRECVIQNNLLQKRATQNTVVGQQEYTLPVDILRLHSVKYDAIKLQVTTLNQFDATYEDADERGTPVTAYLWAGKLNLYPLPDAVKPLIIDYTYEPAAHVVADLAGASVQPSIPVEYHNRLVDYCIAQVALQDDNQNLYNLKMQEFITGVTNLNSDREHDVDLYPFITVSTRDSGNQFDDWYDYN